MKYQLLILLLIIVSLTSCLTGSNNIKRLPMEGDVTDEYIDATFKNVYDLGVTLSYKDGIDRILDIFRKTIIDDRNTTEKEKEDSIAYLKSVELQDYRYLEFSFNSPTAYLKSELNFKFSLSNLQGEDLLETVYYFPIKQTTVYYRNNMPSHSIDMYSYIWLIKAKIKMTPDNISTEKSPLKFVVTYPNDKSRTYEITPFIEE